MKPLQEEWLLLLLFVLSLATSKTSTSKRTEMF